jgi:atypical dual specificity phosphatase
VLHNFSYIVDGVLAGCAHPASGGDLRQALQSLIDQGIGALVSLDEQGIPLHYVAEFGLQYLHLPIPDFGTPTFEQAAQLVEFIEQQRRAGRAVVLHCHAGFGRTGTMLACYLVAQGMSAAEALRYVRNKRPGSVETDEQEQFVHDFEVLWKDHNSSGSQPAP